MHSDMSRDFKKMSLLLKKTEDKYDCIRDISNEGIMEWDIFKNKTLINKRFISMLELTTEDRRVFNIDIFLKMIQIPKRNMLCLE